MVLAALFSRRQLLENRFGQYSTPDDDKWMHNAFRVFQDCANTLHCSSAPDSVAHCRQKGDYQIHNKLTRLPHAMYADLTVPTQTDSGIASSSTRA